MDVKIVGGTVKIEKKLFAKEMLKPSSPLKILLGKAGGRSKPVKHSVKEGGYVVVTFEHRDRVFIKEDYEAFFKGIKSEYGDAVQGSLVLSMGILDDAYNDVYHNIDL